MPKLTIDHGLIFFPRGGSALVAKNLTEQLRASGHPSRVFAGSLGSPGDYSHAPTFYDPDHLIASDYNPAASVHGAGDPLEAPVPMHPSYEDRPGVADRVFAAVAPHTNTHLEDYWTRQFAAHRAGEAGLLHLHHLTPQHAAARRLERTVVTTLHGTDIKFLQHALDRVRRARDAGATLAELARRERPAASPAPAGSASERWNQWTHSAYWIQTLREYAQASSHIVTVSEQDQALARDLLHVPEHRIEVIPNGVDTTLFHPAPAPDDAARRRLLQRWLVHDPHGWTPTGGPGTVSYTPADVDRLLRDDHGRRRPLLLWVGRFLGFKRLDLLLHAFAALTKNAPVRPALLLLGGFPGEWEGEHPHALAERLGLAADVYFAGWRPHTDLTEALNASDLFVTPSIGEPFGLVCLEAMATATPVVAAASGGPLATINPSGPQPTGWLTVPGDADDLAATLLSAITNPQEITRRGHNARRFVLLHYSWQTIADRYAQTYDRVQGAVHVGHVPLRTVRRPTLM